MKVLGPALFNIGSLLHGCAEQTMASFAPNIFCIAISWGCLQWAKAICYKKYVCSFSTSGTLKEVLLYKTINIIK